MYEDGEIKTYNCAGGIADENLGLIKEHIVCMKQARTGKLPDTDINSLDDETRKINRVRGLTLTIQAQLEIANFNRATIKAHALRKWKKKYKTDKERKEHPFEEDENDYFDLMVIASFLKKQEQKIILAEKTPEQEDDFIIENQNGDRKKLELTKNYFDMIEALEETFEELYTILLNNKIVSAGIEEDEEKSYKEKEKEAIRRVAEA